MLTSMERLQNLENLRNYVNKTLCEHDQLEFGAFRMTERILVRGSRPCGIFFCLHGPRSVKVTAIWETDRNTILFYSSTGRAISSHPAGVGPRVSHHCRVKNIGVTFVPAIATVRFLALDSRPGQTVQRFSN